MKDIKIFEKLSEDWKDIQSLAVFGFGKVGRGGIEALRCRLSVNAIIDNNEQLKGQLYKDIPIINFPEYKARGGAGQDSCFHFGEPLSIYSRRIGKCRIYRI